MIGVNHRCAQFGAFASLRRYETLWSGLTRLATIAFAVLFMGRSPTVEAAAPPKPKGKPAATKKSVPPKPKPSAPPEAPFDPAVQKLPMRFTGNTVEWVLKNTAITPKGEFETSAEYAHRLSTFSSKMYAFVANDVYASEFAYDADVEKFSIKIYPSVTDVQSRLRGYYRPFNVQRTKVDESTYVGTNAYGATTTVTKTTWKLTQIITDEWEPVLSVSHEPLAFSFKVPRDRARTLKPNLRILYVCLPEATQYPAAAASTVPGATGLDISKATISDPDETWRYYVALKANLLQVWVFDWVTGEILARFTPTGMQLDAEIPLIPQ